MKLHNQKVEREKAISALREGKVVHSFNTQEPHITDGENPCWCSPEAQEYDTGGVLITHRQVTWQ